MSPDSGLPKFVRRLSSQGAVSESVGLPLNFVAHRLALTPGVLLFAASMGRSRLNGGLLTGLTRLGC